MIWNPNNSDDQLSGSDLNALNRQLAKIIAGRNSAPDPELGGLSPDQVSLLIHSEWGTAGSPIQCNTNMTLAGMNTSQVFRDARTFLQAIPDNGGVKATAKKNLPRQFVTTMVTQYFPAEILEKVYQYHKVLNETDVWRLHLARIVCQTAELVRLVKGTFVVPQSQKALLSDDQAGELGRRLFLAYFRKFNMAYVQSYGTETPGLQSTVGYTLYRLGVVAADWCPAKGLPEQVLLPAVFDEIAAAIHGRSYITPDSYLEGSLLRPLLDWGLLEGQFEPETKFMKRLKAVRVTPLFQSFLRFELA